MGEVSGSRGLKIVDERESKPGLFTYTADVAVFPPRSIILYTRVKGRGGEGCEIFTASEEREEGIVGGVSVRNFLVEEDAFREISVKKFWKE